MKDNELSTSRGNSNGLKESKRPTEPTNNVISIDRFKTVSNAKRNVHSQSVTTNTSKTKLDPYYEQQTRYLGLFTHYVAFHHIAIINIELLAEIKKNYKIKRIDVFANVGEGVSVMVQTHTGPTLFYKVYDKKFRMIEVEKSNLLQIRKFSASLTISHPDLSPNPNIEGSKIIHNSFSCNSSILLAGIGVVENKLACDRLAEGSLDKGSLDKGGLNKSSFDKATGFEPKLRNIRLLNKKVLTFNQSTQQLAYTDLDTLLPESIPTESNTKSDRPKLDSHNKLNLPTDKLCRGVILWTTLPESALTWAIQISFIDFSAGANYANIQFICSSGTEFNKDIIKIRARMCLQHFTLVALAEAPDDLDYIAILIAGGKSMSKPKLIQELSDTLQNALFAPCQFKHQFIEPNSLPDFVNNVVTDFNAKTSYEAPNQITFHETNNCIWVGLTKE